MVYPALKTLFLKEGIKLFIKNVVNTDEEA